MEKKATAGKKASTEKKTTVEKKTNVEKKALMGYCAFCEEVTEFVKRRCVQCGGRYDEVVPESYRDNYRGGWVMITRAQEMWDERYK
jgi:hypothetical protein